MHCKAKNTDKSSIESWFPAAQLPAPILLHSLCVQHLICQKKTDMQHFARQDTNLWLLFTYIPVFLGVIAWISFILGISVFHPIYPIVSVFFAE